LAKANCVPLMHHWQKWRGVCPEAFTTHWNATVPAMTVTLPPRTSTHSTFADHRERRNHAKQLRDKVPRDAHDAWVFMERADPLKMIARSCRGRLRRFLPIRHGRMARSPLDFVRGTALVMATDLKRTPASGITVQACGDAHLLNFGLFASPERTLLFDVNDFDETLPGPWEWDIKRLAASLVIAGRQRGTAGSTCLDIARACAKSYRKHIRRFSKLCMLDLWYSRVVGESVVKVFPANRQERVSGHLEEARENGQDKAKHQFVVASPRARRISDHKPTRCHDENLLPHKTVVAMLGRYRRSLQEDRRALFDRYRLVDHAFKVVGVESVGTRSFIVLLEAAPNDTLLLQIKEATPSVLEGLAGPAWHGNQGQRIAHGQRLIQGFSDVFLGWTTEGKRDYYVRQLRDMKGTLKPETFSSVELRDYAKLCGWVLARAHARSGDAGMITGYLGKNDIFDGAVAKFASSYADQIEQDFDRFRQAIKKGRIRAETGV
jgi:uncharacterized protein (DUF2252 family)